MNRVIEARKRVVVLDSVEFKAFIKRMPYNLRSYVVFIQLSNFVMGVIFGLIMAGLITLVRGVI